MANKTNKLSTEPYKGVRDFFPNDQKVQNYIFSKMREVAERFGYSEYSASVLEPAELFKAKSGEEIVDEQMYVFKDRGGREVALRPEMTPTLTRLVSSKKRELAAPIRWYTIANMFRYERPQRGRMREHWQLNCDILGVEDVHAEAEIIAIVNALLQRLGLKSSQFEIRLGSRKILEELITPALNKSTKTASLKDVLKAKVMRILDRIWKRATNEILDELGEVIERSEAQKLLKTMDSSLKDVRLLLSSEGVKEADRLARLNDTLESFGVTNVKIQLSLARGFDYYTGIVFEVFDKHPDNKRALFGGGRYDNLLEMFGVDRIPAVGFGMGDIAIRDVLETYNLFPENLQNSTTAIYICILDIKCFKPATLLANSLRSQGLNVAVDYSGRKIGDQVKKADKDKVPYVLCVGEEEVKSGGYKVKKLDTGEQRSLKENEIKSWIA